MVLEAILLRIEQNYLQIFFCFISRLHLLKIPNTLNDYKPVALTSLIMKSLERTVKDVLLNIMNANLDSLQFACRTGRVVDDAISALLNTILAHLEVQRLLCG